MQLTYDESSDAAYIKFNEDNKLEYDHFDGEWPINVNVSTSGEVMGIEILNASSVLSKEFINEQSQSKSAVQQYLDKKKLS